MNENIQIFLNSKRADKYVNGQTGDCIFHLPHINIKRSSSITVSILSAVIPYSFYNVNSNNDKLVYRINNNPIETIVLTHSNYNINTLIKHLMELLGSNFLIIYNASSNKLTFSNHLDEFELDMLSTCFELIGFSNIDHVSNSRLLVSDNVVNLFTYRTLHIVSDNFILGNIDSYNPNKSNILASIPINTIFNGIISYSNIHNVSNEINNTRNLSYLHIQLTNQDGNIIEFNNAHWSITLLLSIK